MATKWSFITILSISSLLLSSLGWHVAGATPNLSQSTGRILYVKPGAFGTCTNSWANACNLLMALARANSGDEIWVAAGTHYPNDMYPDNYDRTLSFALTSGVAIYGGFAGYETARDQRDWNANLTTLSGDLNRNGVIDGDAYHVVTCDGFQTTILDGFTITMGRASEGPGETLRDSGGGILNFSTYCILSNLIITLNRAHYGGGIANMGSSNPKLINVVLSQNYASRLGGGIYNEAGSPSLTNLTFYNNTADAANDGRGGGIYVAGGSLFLTNSIVWGNQPTIDQIDGNVATVTYSDIQGGYAGFHNINANPMFVNAASNNWRLLPGSPAIDTGNYADIPDDVLNDLDDSLRKVGDQVDMGAYEFQVGSPIIFVDKSNAGPFHDGTSWEHAYPRLQTALSAAQGDNEIWVAEGVYYPGPTGNRTATFQLKNGIAIYGGFDGTETERDQRDWNVHITVLSGDIDRNDATDSRGVVTDFAKIVGNNSSHVMTSSGLTETVALDGFTITAGNANVADFSYSSGGGLYNNGNATLTNLSFSGNNALNEGGGIYHDAGTLIVSNSTFSGNGAGYGGGILNRNYDNGTTTVSNSTFSTNYALHGGGIYNDVAATLTVSNSTFSGNSALQYGGGILNMWLTSVSNSTFSGNSAGEAGGGIHNANYLVDLTNTIVADSPSGGNCFYITDKGGNISSDDTCPAGFLLTDPLLGPLQDNGGPTLTHALLSSSPAIDAGNPQNCPATDQRGIARPVDGDRDDQALCDIGAFEFQFTVLYLPLLRK